MTEAAERMRALVEELNRTAYAYYVLDKPEISDMQWDRMYDELTKLEAETGIILEDSPTRKVGGAPRSGFEQHRHLHRLWSMDKVQSYEALEAWIARTEKLAGQTDLQYYIEYKFDGLTLNLTYEGGRLTLHHLDVYRIEDEDEMEEVGLDDCLYGDGVCLIEWPERIRSLLPEDAVVITIEKMPAAGTDERRITVRRKEV